MAVPSRGGATVVSPSKLVAAVQSDDRSSSSPSDPDASVELPSSEPSSPLPSSSR